MEVVSVGPTRVQASVQDGHQVDFPGPGVCMAALCHLVLAHACPSLGVCNHISPICISPLFLDEPDPRRGNTWQLCGICLEKKLSWITQSHGGPGEAWWRSSVNTLGHSEVSTNRALVGTKLSLAAEEQD